MVAAAGAVLCADSHCQLHAPPLHCIGELLSTERAELENSIGTQVSRSLIFCVLNGGELCDACGIMGTLLVYSKHLEHHLHTVSRPRKCPLTGQRVRGWWSGDVTLDLRSQFLTYRRQIAWSGLSGAVLRDCALPLVQVREQMSEDLGLLMWTSASVRALLRPIALLPFWPAYCVLDNLVLPKDPRSMA